MQHRLRKDLDDYLSRRAHPKTERRFTSRFKRFRKHLTVKDHQLDELSDGVTVIHPEPNILAIYYRKIKEFFKPKQKGPGHTS